jgi:hypothetical protein
MKTKRFKIIDFSSISMFKYFTALNPTLITKEIMFNDYRDKYNNKKLKFNNPKKLMCQ